MSNPTVPHLQVAYSTSDYEYVLANSASVLSAESPRWLAKALLEGQPSSAGLQEDATPWPSTWPSGRPRRRCSPLRRPPAPPRPVPDGQGTCWMQLESGRRHRAARVTRTAAGAMSAGSARMRSASASSRTSHSWPTASAPRAAYGHPRSPCSSCSAAPAFRPRASPRWAGCAGGVGRGLLAAGGTPVLRTMPGRTPLRAARTDRWSWSRPGAPPAVGEVNASGCWSTGGRSSPVGEHVANRVGGVLGRALVAVARRRLRGADENLGGREWRVLAQPMDSVTPGMCNPPGA